MKRADIIQAITVYTAQGDNAAATRLYVNNRISATTFKRAVARGHEVRRKMAAGMTAYDALRTTP
jgi:hypothetical protein